MVRVGYRVEIDQMCLDFLYVVVMEVQQVLSLKIGVVWFISKFILGKY